MSRVEVIAKRTARSKTFDNGDGTFTFEAGGGIAHHQSNGMWVETDTTWKDLAQEFASGVYPYTVKLNKGQRTLTITADGVNVTLLPQGTRVPVISTSGNTVTLAGLWRGITALFILAPERPVIHFIRTAAQFDNPQITVSGLSDLTPMLTALYEDLEGQPVMVPVTNNAGTLTYDLASVPVGAVVR